MSPGPDARGRVGAGTWFACKTQQELFGQLVLVGKAESLWGLSSQHGGCLAALVSRGPEEKGLCLRVSLLFHVRLSPCSDQVESAGAWKKLL